MKKCFKCGAELPDSTNFCPHCGQKLDAMPNYKVPGQGNTTPQRGGTTLLYVLVAVVVLAAGIIAFLLFSKNNSDNSNNDVEITDSVMMSEKSLSPEEIRQRKEEEIKQRKKSLLSDYERILKQNSNESYMIVDLNNNGFPELWISYRYGQNYDNLWHVYHGQQGRAKEIYTAPDGDISRLGNSIMIESYEYGTNYVRKYTYNGNDISAETIYNSDYDYSRNINLPDDQSCPATDLTALRKAFNF